MARPTRTNGIAVRSIGERDGSWKARWVVPFMRSLCGWSSSRAGIPEAPRLPSAPVRAASARHWVLSLGVLVLLGCDLLDPAKSDNPVFSPPPPRNTVDAQKTGASKPQSADAAVASNTAMAESGVKQVGFVGEKTADTSKIPPTEVVATVDGQPIFASELFERAYPEPLTPEGLSLLIADKVLKSNRISDEERKQLEHDYRRLQEKAIHKYLREYIQERVLTHALEITLEKENKEKMEAAVSKMFDEYVDTKLKEQFKVSARHEIEKRLHEVGSSLDGLKSEFRYKLLSDEYVRGKAKKEHIVGREEIVKYYEEHLDKYDYPERVQWELLQVNFEKNGGERKALDVLEKAVDALHRGVSFEKVARKFSDGPHAGDGGKQPWTRPASVVDEKTAAFLHQLPPDKNSPVFRSKDSFCVVRVIERKPAGRSTLSEVQDTIKQTLEDELQKEAVREVILEAYKSASIETPYLTPEEANTPAGIAGISIHGKKQESSRQKSHDRS
jgi:parvulin-like peptidyl-prolyl isomerase